jgi:hypothetical protein
MSQYFLVTHNSPNRSNFTGAVGCQFTVSQTIVITQLGRYYDAGSSQNHQITLWAVSGQTKLAQGTILASSSSDANGFKWVTVSSVTLTPGNTYAIAVDETNGGDTWPDQGAVTVNSYATLVRAVYATTQGAYPNNNQNSGQTYDTPNMYDFTPQGMLLTDGTETNNWADALVKAGPATLTLSDSETNNWADAVALSLISPGALVSQVVVEVLVPGVAQAEVSQVVVEVMMPRRFNQPHISVST